MMTLLCITHLNFGCRQLFAMSTCGIKKVTEKFSKKKVAEIAVITLLSPS